VCPHSDASGFHQPLCRKASGPNDIHLEASNNSHIRCDAGATSQTQNTYLTECVPELLIFCAMVSSLRIDSMTRIELTAGWSIVDSALVLADPSRLAFRGSSRCDRSLRECTVVVSSISQRMERVLFHTSYHDVKGTSASTSTASCLLHRSMARIQNRTETAESTARQSTNIPTC
jgi:hypothetical protein